MLHSEFTKIAPLLSHHATFFLEIMGYNLMNARNKKKLVENIKVAKFEASIVKEWKYDSLNF